MRAALLHFITVAIFLVLHPAPPQYSQQFLTIIKTTKTDGQHGAVGNTLFVCCEIEPHCVHEQENLPSLLSTGCFQEQIIA